MRRIAALLAGLLLCATSLAAQKADTVTTTTRTATVRQVPVTDSVITIKTVITVHDGTVPATLTGLTLAPASVALLAGASQPFTPTGTWSDGAAHPLPTVSWTATGGTISGGGTYTAGSSAGTFRVIAVASGVGDTSAVTISVPDTTTPPPTGSVLFSSDWSAATGVSLAALTDGGKWTNTWEPCPNAPITVVPNPGTFPASIKNVLQVRNGNNGNCQWVQAQNKWPLPAIGKSVAFRVYLRSEIPDAVGVQNWSALHPMESGYNSGTSGGYWEWKMGNNANGTFPLTFETTGIQTTLGPSNGTGPAGVKKFETWRLEWKFTRNATGRYALDMRAYNQAGALIYDKNNIYAAWGSSQKLGTAGANLAVDDQQIRQARVGINGGPTMSGVVYVYWGGFAVCTDWCGGVQ